MESNRHLAAIMFTDISGYTAMMQQDEATALRWRTRHRSVFQACHDEFQGEVVQYFGDGSLSVFKSSVQAVRCAIAIQQELQKDPQVPLRVGIHTGDIIRTAEEVIGDGVNIASRIESLAVPGSVLISRQLQFQVKNHGIETTSLGIFDLKNVMTPLEVFAIEAPGLMVPERSMLAMGKVNEKKADQATASQSIAILPFINMSNDPEQDYFCDGITEEIINSLSPIQNLKVIARTSAFAFKNKNEDVRKIGKQLEVETILEGSVRKSGNKIRISSQLVRTKDGSQFWSQRYDRELKDIFELQDEISMAIVDALKVNLLGNERQKVLETKTRDLQAYNLYLKGLYEWYKRTRSGMTESIELFQQALSLDPQYTQAKVGLANAYIAMSDWGEMIAAEALPKAKSILDEALYHDADHPAIYAALSYHDICNWDKEGFARNHRKAISLDPEFPFAHHIHTAAQNLLGDFDTGLASSLIARKNDPLSTMFNFSYAHLLYQSGQLEAACEHFRFIITLDPKFKPAHLFMAHSQMALNQPDETVEAFRGMLESDPISASAIPELEAAYTDHGFEGAIRWMIDRGLKFYGHALNKPYHTASFRAFLGDKDKAFDDLFELCEIRSFRLTGFRYDVLFDNLKDDPRYQQLEEKIGLWKS
jgi:TolB-like protein/class 3 adenylate cyclase/Tfp pilus assembly protein PilF